MLPVSNVFALCLNRQVHVSEQDVGWVINSCSRSSLACGLLPPFRFIEMMMLQLLLMPWWVKLAAGTRPVQRLLADTCDETQKMHCKLALVELDPSFDCMTTAMHACMKSG